MNQIYISDSQKMKDVPKIIKNKLNHWSEKLN